MSVLSPLQQGAVGATPDPLGAAGRKKGLRLTGIRELGSRRCGCSVVVTELRSLTPVEPWRTKGSRARSGSWARTKAEACRRWGTSRWGSWCSPAPRTPPCWQWTRGGRTATYASAGNSPALRPRWGLREPANTPPGRGAASCWGKTVGRRGAACPQLTGLTWLPS